MSDAAVNEPIAGTEVVRQPAWGGMTVIILVAVLAMKPLMSLVQHLADDDVAGLLAAAVPMVVSGIAAVLVWRIRPRG